VAVLSLLFGFVPAASRGARGVWDGTIERLVEIVGVFPAVVAVAPFARSSDARRSCR
jgi:hypothetical protein